MQDSLDILQSPQDQAPVPDFPELLTTNMINITSEACLNGVKRPYSDSRSVTGRPPSRIFLENSAG